LSSCKYCQQTIGWDTSSGKPVPINADGSRHDCRSQKVDQPSKQSNASLDAPTEERIRGIAREEIVKFYVEIASKYEKAKA